MTSSGLSPHFDMFLVLKSCIYMFSFEHNHSISSIESSELQLCLASHVFTVKITSNLGA